MLCEPIQKAYSVLEGKGLDKGLAIELSKLHGSDILDLISLANKVKNKFTTDTHICAILNARSGDCSEDCKYCAQSVHNEAKVDVYPLVSKEEILEAADRTYRSGVGSFGIVTSGFGFLKVDDDFRVILEAMDAIKKSYPDMKLCASLGALSDETARELEKRELSHYNHNIQVNVKKYNELVSKTHTVEQRIETIRLVKKYGMKACAGGIIGLGESMEDRVELAFTLKELEVDIIPLNALIPIAGTPLEDRKTLPVVEIAKTFAIFRLIHPAKVIKFAAGRETVLKDFQGLLMLAGANGMLTGGYLTTRGRETADDRVFIRQLSGFAD